MRNIKKGNKGNNHLTWRNEIARQALLEKEHGKQLRDRKIGDGYQNLQRIPKNRKRYRYQDQNFIQNVQALKTYVPVSLNDLKYITQSARKEGLKVKAVGSGHSYSDIMTTSDYSVTTDELRNVLKFTKGKYAGKITHFPWLDQNIQKDGYLDYLKNKIGVDPNFNMTEEEIDELKPSLYEFEAGIKIENLNDLLWEDGKSLQNMGTYQGQSFIGAVSTSTHGSGINLGPLPDMIKSILLVAEDGVTFRIEPNDGISEKLKPLENYDIDNKEFKRLVDEKKIFTPIRSLPLTIFGIPLPISNFDYLIQDDDWFNSALVNVGCFGIIYSVIIEVVPAFYLLETVELDIWKKLKKRLIAKAPDLFENKEFTPKGSDFPTGTGFSKIYQMEINIHPHKHNGVHYCRITRRYKLVPAESGPFDKYNLKRIADKGDRAASFLGKEFLQVSLNKRAEDVLDTDKDIEILTKAILRRQGGGPVGSIWNIINNIKNKHGNLLNQPKQYSEHYFNRNYRVYVNPTKGISGYGVETAFSMKEQKKLNFNGEEGKELLPAYIVAVDHSLKLADQHLKIGKFTQTAPTSIRFVKASRAYLSPQYEEDTAMIEMLNLADTHGGKELFYRYQSQFFQYGGRPHWGLDLSVTTGNNNLLEKMYPKFKCWKAVYDTLNANGTFNNRFTDRMGLSIQDFPQEPKEECS